MNRKMVLNILGKILLLEAALLTLPLITSLIYKESVALSFIITIAIALILGLILYFIARNPNKVFFAKEGFLIVALSWVGMSVIGSLPFVISGEIPNFVDAFFETVSGFTTTGASILTNVESLSHGMLFWRSFTHWLGGMGVLVFIMAIIPSFSDRSIHIMRAEMPGPIIGKIVPRAKQTAKILYLIYIVMTVLEIIFLALGDMPLFDSILHAFGTAGTGGFGIKAASIGAYGAYSQWVIAVFMFLFGINFNLYYLLLLRHIKSIFKSGELWCYVSVFLVASGLITYNILPRYENISDAIRNSVFQVSSIMTSTGYATTDFNMWPTLSKGILLLLMFMGACAGSTGGGLKVSRVIILFKSIIRELRRMISPRSVTAVSFEGKKLDDNTISATLNYFSLYMVSILAIFAVLSFDVMGFEENFSAAVSCFNNIGPGFGAIGPAGSYAGYSALSKLALSYTMLLGRLELYPMIVLFIPSVWKKK